MIKSPLCFILPIVYIIHRSEFIKMPNCVDFRASLCSIKWLMTVCFEAKQSCLEKVFLKLTRRWVWVLSGEKCVFQGEGAALRGLEAEESNEEGWQTWIWRGEGRRAGQDSSMEIQAEARWVLPFGSCLHTQQSVRRSFIATFLIIARG